MKPFIVSTLLVLIAYFCVDKPELYKFDAGHYQQIATHGYNESWLYAFFPVYPIITHFINPFIVSNLCAAIYCWLLRKKGLQLWAFMLSPCSVFFHIAYSESLFVLAMVLSLECKSLLAATIGTAIRPVGVALIPPFMFKTKWWFLGFCGLGFYILYQWSATGDPLTFVKVQEKWQMGDVGPLSDRIPSLLSFEPIWKNFQIPNTLSCVSMNRIYWALTLITVIVCFWKKWITQDEFLVSLGLLLIPYATKGYENAMLSHGRFAAIIYPAFIVFNKIPKYLAWPIIVGMACLMFHYAKGYFGNEMVF